MLVHLIVANCLVAYSFRSLVMCSVCDTFDLIATAQCVYVCPSVCIQQSGKEAKWQVAFLDSLEMLADWRT